MKKSYDVTCTLRIQVTDGAYLETQQAMEAYLEQLFHIEKATVKGIDEIKNDERTFKMLGERRYLIITDGFKRLGTLNPDDILVFFEERLFGDEVEDTVAFLKWCRENNKTFGRGNYEEVYAEYLESKR